MASVVQVPLTDADRSSSSRLASRCYATGNCKSENTLGPSRALFHHFKGDDTLRHSVFRDVVPSTVCGSRLVPVASVGKCFNKVLTLARAVRQRAHFSLNWLTPKWSRRARRSCAIVSPRRAAHLSR